jgi:hypothetical protein
VAALVLWLGSRLYASGALRGSVAVALASFIVVVALLPAAAVALKPRGALQAVYVAEFAGARPRLRRDAAIDFDWRRDAPVIGPFRAAWRGALRVERAGDYRLRLEGDGAHALFLDGRQLAAVSAPAGERVSLSAGHHALVLVSRPPLHAPFLRLLWRPPAGAESVVPSAAYAPRTRGP